jgi:hypothetical protein
VSATPTPSSLQEPVFWGPVGTAFTFQDATGNVMTIPLDQVGHIGSRRRGPMHQVVPCGPVGRKGERDCPPTPLTVEVSAKVSLLMPGAAEAAWR